MGLAAVVVLVYFANFDFSPVQGQDVTVDLRTGTYSPQELGPGISWKIPPVADLSNTACDREGVMKLTFDNNTRVRVQIEMEISYYDVGRISYHTTFSIGDSEWDTGIATDNGKQSNDAEISGINWSLDVFGGDGNSTREASTPDTLYSGIFALKNADILSISISNNHIRMVNGKDLILIDSKNVFALNGQPDMQGPVNYDIFLAMNRNIVEDYYETDTRGGVCRVSVTWHDS